MARRFVTPAQRRRRILRDALLLVVILVVLTLRLDFPILTARQALAATQTRYLFGPGEVIATVDNSASRFIAWLAARNSDRVGIYDRYYILRQGDWYAWCGMNHSSLLFWQAGELEAVENDPDLPLVPLIISDGSNRAVLVISNDPEITRVELSYPILSEAGGHTLFSVSGTQQAEHCFLISYRADRTTHSGFFLPENLQVKGYDASGTLVYQSPTPESWATRYELR